MRIMAVYDVDADYAERFTEFANQKEKTPFTVVAFTNLERLKAFGEEQSIELLLVGESVPEQELEGVNAGQIIWLSETGMAKEENTIVYKYQASDSVLREVLACYQLEADAEHRICVGRKSHIIGVYSPISRCGKSSFCVTLGQVLGKERKVLLLSMEVCSGIFGLTGIRYEATLSDLVYYFRQGDYNPLRLGSLVYQWGSMDYIPPVRYSEDMRDISGQELVQLIDQIGVESNYEEIILDLDHFEQGLEELLEACSVIYVPIKEDVVSERKLEAWKEDLVCSGRGYLWDKVQILKLPEGKGKVLREGYLEQLVWGELGDYVRELTGGSWRGED